MVEFGARKGPEQNLNQEPGGYDRLTPALSGLLLLTFMFTFNFLCRVSAGPLMPTIQAELGISHAAAGSMFLSISIGYVISIALSGFITARMTHRNMIGLSNILVGLILLFMGLVNSVIALRLGMFFLGLATGAYFPSAVAIITTMLKPGLWARGLAIHGLGPTTGFIIAPLLAEVLLLWTGWRGAMTSIGGLTVILGLAYLALGRGGRFTGQRPDLATLKTMLSRPLFWIMTLVAGLGIGANQGVYNMLPVYLMDVAGLDRSQANLIVSISRMAPLISLPFAGWMADKFGHSRTMVVALVAGGLGTGMLGVFSGTKLIVAMCAQPVLLTFFFPALFATISEAADERTRSLLVSLTVAGGFFIGIGLLPVGLGWMGDHGLFRWAMAGLAALMLLGAGLSPLLKGHRKIV